jgi:protein-tyrosine phosphatase
VRREARAVQRKLDRAFVLREARGRGASALRRLGKVERVLVLCYGNICRSPYVEARLSPLVESRRLQVRSRGFHPEEARRTPERIQSAARTRGVDLSSHRSARVSLDDLRWADAILVMDGENHASLRALSEESLAKELWLGAFDRDERVEIADPYDAEAAEVDAVFARIDACVASLQEALGTKA